MLFAILLITLIVLITTFICFFVWLRKMDAETFKSLCQKKVERIANRKGYQVIKDLNISNYNREKLIVNHAIFGRKYIYLISDFFLKGFVSGDEKDNSWLYYDTRTKKHNYLSNLSILKEKLGQPYKGQKIWVSKRNQIIPYIERAEKIPSLSFILDIKNALNCSLKDLFEEL